MGGYLAATTAEALLAAAFPQIARELDLGPGFAGLAFDKLLGYVFALVVAKTYGSTAFGLYIFGVGMFEVAYALTELGLERASIRQIADLSARGRGGPSSARNSRWRRGRRQASRRANARTAVRSARLPRQRAGVHRAGARSPSRVRVLIENGMAPCPLLN